MHAINIENGMINIDIEILNCLKVIKSSGTILYPTDTIWGIGCDATDAKAVDKIFAIKKREESKSLIVLVDGFDMLKEHVETIPDVAYDLLEAMDKPVTIIYPKGKNLTSKVMPADGSIAIRLVKNDFCVRLIRALGKPIVSTSANIAGEISPVNFQGISHEIVDSVDYVVSPLLDTLTEIKPSRIIKLEENGMFSIVRE